MKQLQNRIAEGGLTLPVAAAGGLAVWLLSGLVSKGMWPQLVLFILTVYNLIELSNSNALLRVRSRMVSSTFIVLSAMACYLFDSVTGAMAQFCFSSFLLLLFHTYQNKQSTGRTFYAFLFIGVASLVFVHILWLVPAIWILMATQLQSLSGRTWLASLIGLAAPFWFLSLWFIYQQDFTPLGAHMAQLWDFRTPHYSFQLSHVLVYVFTLLLTTVGILHFWRFSFEDKIRIRLLFGFFTTMTILLFVLCAAQPQLANVLMRLVFLVASPLIAHLFTFTSGKLSNILFFSTLGLALAIIGFNIYMLSAQP